ncbi:PAS domain S-box protein [Candidatus Sumerlaeota bacterium]|nr:PAS domain S-box protein [Candidatus Sumerlaeota bacterium]
MTEPTDSHLTDMTSEESRALGPVVEEIYREFPRYLGFSRASLMLFDEESQALVSDELIGVHRSGETSSSAPQPIGFSISGKCFAEKRPIVVDDCSQSDLVPRRFVEQLRLKSCAAVPVITEGRVIGVLRVDDTERTHRFTAEDVEFFSMLAAMLGSVVTNPRLYRELREAERAVRDSERNFRALAENANDGILIAVGDGELVYANRRAAEIAGLPPETFLDLSLRDLIPVPLRGEVLERYLQILSGEALSQRHHETLFTRPDGSVVFIELSVTQTEWRGKRAVMAIVRDITVRRQLEKQVLDITEDKGNRFGRDLHDGLGQTLAAIAVRCKVLERGLAAESIPHSEEAARLTQLVQQAIDTVQQMARGLAPVQLESRGLPIALQDLGRDLEDAFGVRCHVHCEATAEISDLAVATQLFRIAQEAANNAVRHGSPRSLEITLAREGDAVTLCIRDDGSGFSEEEASPRGMGLLTMRYRARTLGAKLDIQSHGREGVTVLCKLPRREEEL